MKTPKPDPRGPFTVKEIAPGAELAKQLTGRVTAMGDVMGEEIDRLTDQLTDCWLLLDMIARRALSWDEMQDRAEALLKRQQAREKKP